MDREGVEPESTTFNILLEAMASENAKMEEIETVLEDMGKLNLKMENITRSLMLTVLALHNNVEPVAKSLEKKVQRREMPTVSCLTAVMSMDGKCNMISKGNEMRLSLRTGGRELLGRDIAFLCSNW
jgi:hypothetical protein